MTKWMAGSALILTLMASSARAALTQAEILVGRESAGPRHQPLVLSLKSEGPIVRCQAPGMPFHRIDVEGLKGISAPFKETNGIGDCVMPLRWSTFEPKAKIVKTCYRRGENYVLDEVLRWCTSM